VLRWAEGELQAKLAAGSDIMGMKQSEELLAAARTYLQGVVRSKRKAFQKLKPIKGRKHTCHGHETVQGAARQSAHLPARCCYRRIG